MNAQRDVTVTIRPAGTNVYALSPFPFAATGAQFAFAGRRVEPGLGSTKDGWSAALKRAPTEWELFRLTAD